jgi:drug/metabolite transporter (DMT)-like permease
MVSVISHAYWNFLTKRAGNKGIFIGLAKIAEAAIFAIPFVAILVCVSFDLSLWYFVVVAALLAFLNYTFLIRAYAHADLSVAYPISRASTLFLPFLAYYFIGETIDVTGAAAIVLVTVGVFAIRFDSIRSEGIAGLIKSPGTGYALLAALTVALYTVWDKIAVGNLHPFLYFYAYSALVAVFYAVLTFTRFGRADIRREWQINRAGILQVALLNTFTYVLILIALGMSKATYIGALRQLSLVVGAFFGWRLLHESVSVSRIVGIALLVIGGGLTLFAG